MFVSVCWNVIFVLEHVGTINSIFRCCVGTKKVFHKMLERSNKQSYANNQTYIQNNGLLLERWYVGAGNDRQPHIKNFYEN
jgi:hypothetical protein